MLPSLGFLKYSVTGPSPFDSVVMARKTYIMEKSNEKNNHIFINNLDIA